MPLQCTAAGEEQNNAGEERGGRGTGDEESKEIKKFKIPVR